MTNESSSAQAHPLPENEVWKQLVLKFQKPSRWRASWQILNTIIPYGLCWYLMYVCLPISWWLVIPLAVLAGALLVRAFIIFHDCGHGSFFKSQHANDAVGFLAGVLTFTPYYHWRWEHAIHHSSAGDLDRRGTGDVWTLTVQEYLESSRWKKFAYRLARNPFVLFVLAPVFLFLIRQRFPSPKANRRERHSVHAMNVAILAMAVALSLVFGVKAYMLIQLTILMLAGGAGVWMFYVQHQF
jgi:omega-6 fatty acid desaturase (delta-12 desaturase)